MATSSNSTGTQTLSEQLQSCVDSARQCKADLGFNAFCTFVVRVQYANGRIGDGAATVTELELQPPPEVEMFDVEGRLRPSGLDEEGDLMLTGISRAYAETDLFSPDDVNREDTLFLYRIEGAVASDGVRPRYYVPQAPPVLNAGGRKGRMKANSWTVHLRRTVDPQL